MHFIQFSSVKLIHWKLSKDFKVTIDGANTCLLAFSILSYCLLNSSLFYLFVWFYHLLFSISNLCLIYWKESQGSADLSIFYGLWIPNTWKLPSTGQVSINMSQSEHKDSAILVPRLPLLTFPGSLWGRKHQHYLEVWIIWFDVLFH